MIVDPTQEPFLFEGQYATGALYRPPDPKNFPMGRMRDVQPRLGGNYPPNDERLKQHVVHIYNQMSDPACVSAWLAGLSTGNEHKERRGETILFDFLKLHLATGPRNQGRWPQDLLKIAQHEGVPVANSAKRYRVGSYAFAPTNSPEAFTDTMKAALAAGHLCGIASRLWSGLGWETAGALLGWETYHQYGACGYRADPAPFGSFLCWNSWGKSFGREGFFWVPAHLLFIHNNHEGALIGSTVIDGIDDDLAPLPNPNPPTPTPTPTPPNDFAREVIRLVNAHRVSIGRTALAEHPSLMQSAAAKSRDMGTRGYFAHEHEGKGPLQWITEAGVQNPTVWGENIAAGQPDPSASAHAPIYAVSAMRNGQILSDNPGWMEHVQSPGGAFTAWMNSPGHRANIEFPGFTHIGVGYEQISPSPYGTYWTQHFVGIGGSPAPTPDPPPPTPDPPPPTPTPTPGLTVEGRLEGGGLEFLREGMVLQASGSGFSGSLTLSRVDQAPTPDPGPDPPPPDPEPAGDLKVNPLITAARGGWNLFVYVTDPLGSVGPAAVQVTGGAAVRMIRSTASLDGQAPATARVTGTPGTALLVTATAGARSGSVTIGIPSGAGDLPPLLEEW
jgi:uncharacterized protein YkwD